MWKYGFRSGIVESRSMWRMRMCWRVETRRRERTAETVRDSKAEMKGRFEDEDEEDGLL